MSLRKTLSSLMVLSALFLAVGAILLRTYALVPFYLTATTAAAVVVLFAVAHFVNRGYTIAANIGAVLAVISVIISAASPTHNAAILDFFNSPLLAVLDLLEIFGFYVFPIAFLVLRIVNNRKFKSRKFD